MENNEKRSCHCLHSCTFLAALLTVRKTRYVPSKKWYATMPLFLLLSPFRNGITLLFRYILLHTPHIHIHKLVYISFNSIFNTLPRELTMLLLAAYLPCLSGGIVNHPKLSSTLFLHNPTTL